MDDDQIDAVVRPRVKRLIRAAGVGLVVGVTDRLESHALGYGAVGRASDQPPSALTLYEIGSVTKVFTATMLARIATGSLSIYDPVSKVIPEIPSLPESITFVSLATHTSGLPRLPRNLPVSEAFIASDPYALYTQDDLLEFLASVRPADLDRRAGRIHYSNLGFAVLGVAIARALGLTYAQAFDDIIARPLGYYDTVLKVAAADRHRLAEGHDRSGRWVPNWHFAAFEGAGGLRSNASDLLGFLREHVDPNSTFADAFRATLRTYSAEFEQRHWSSVIRRLQMRANIDLRRATALPLGVGLGWILVRLPATGTAWVQAGGTGGFGSFVGLELERGVGVVVLHNQQARATMRLWPSYDSSNLGVEILDALTRS